MMSSTGAGLSGSSGVGGGGVRPVSAPRGVKAPSPSPARPASPSGIPSGSIHAAPLQRGSYFERWMEGGNGKPNGGGGGGGAAMAPPSEMSRLSTDRAAYISFLEAQLERASAAALMSETLVARLDAQDAVNQELQDKITALTHLIQLSQAYTERQGQEAGTAVASLHVALQEVSSKVDATSAAVEAERARVSTGFASQSDAQAAATRRLEAQCTNLGQQVATLSSQVSSGAAFAEVNAAVQSLQQSTAAVSGLVSNALERAALAEANATNARTLAEAAKAAAAVAEEQASQAVGASQHASGMAEEALGVSQDASSRCAAAEDVSVSAMRFLAKHYGHEEAASDESLSAERAAAAHARTSGEPAPHGGVWSRAMGDVFHTLAARVSSLESRTHALESTTLSSSTSLTNLVAASEKQWRAELDARSHAIAEQTAAAISELSRSCADAIAEVRTEVDASKTVTSAVQAAVTESAGRYALAAELHGLSERVEQASDALARMDAHVHELHSAVGAAQSASAEAHAAVEGVRTSAAAVGVVDTLAKDVAAVGERLEELRTDALGFVGREVADVRTALREAQDEWQHARSEANAALASAAAASATTAGGEGSAPVTAAAMNSVLEQVEDALKAYVDTQLAGVHAALDGLGAQANVLDTEQKQLVRATDALVDRWTLAHEAVSSLQAQLDDVRAALQNGAAPSRGGAGFGLNASRAESEGSVVGASMFESGSGGSVNARELLRVLDTLVQPRLNDIAAEMQRRLNEELDNMVQRTVQVNTSVAGAQAAALSASMRSAHGSAMFVDAHDDAVSAAAHRSPARTRSAPVPAPVPAPATAAPPVGGDALTGDVSCVSARASTLGDAEEVGDETAFEDAAHAPAANQLPGGAIDALQQNVRDVADMVGALARELQQLRTQQGELASSLHAAAVPSPSVGDGEVFRAAGASARAAAHAGQRSPVASTAAVAAHAPRTPLAPPAARSPAQSGSTAVHTAHYLALDADADVHAAAVLSAGRARVMVRPLASQAPPRAVALAAAGTAAATTRSSDSEGVGSVHARAAVNGALKSAAGTRTVPVRTRAAGVPAVAPVPPPPQAAGRSTPASSASRHRSVSTTVSTTSPVSTTTSVGSGIAEGSEYDAAVAHRGSISSSLAPQPAVWEEPPAPADASANNTAYSLAQAYRASKASSAARMDTTASTAASGSGREGRGVAAHDDSRMFGAHAEHRPRGDSINRSTTSSLLRASELHGLSGVTGEERHPAQLYTDMGSDVGDASFRTDVLGSVDAPHARTAAVAGGGAGSGAARSASAAPPVSRVRNADAASPARSLSASAVRRASSTPSQGRPSTRLRTTTSGAYGTGTVVLEDGTRNEVVRPVSAREDSICNYPNDQSGYLHDESADYPRDAYDYEHGVPVGESSFLQEEVDAEAEEHTAYPLHRGRSTGAADTSLHGSEMSVPRVHRQHAAAEPFMMPRSRAPGAVRHAGRSASLERFEDENAASVPSTAAMHDAEYGSMGQDEHRTSRELLQASRRSGRSNVGAPYRATLRASGTRGSSAVSQAARDEATLSARHMSSPGRRVGFNTLTGTHVVSVQTQVGPAMQGFSHNDVHCGHHRGGAASQALNTLGGPAGGAAHLPSTFGRMPAWYARRAQELRRSAGSAR